jgi:hypothetical protein
MEKIGVPMKPDVPDDVDHRGVESSTSSLDDILPGAKLPRCKVLLVDWC